MAIIYCLSMLGLSVYKMDPYTRLVDGLEEPLKSIFKGRSRDYFRSAKSLTMFS